MDNKGIGIDNAQHWLNHSYVQLKGLYLAEDEAHVANSIVSIQGAGTANPTMGMRAGDQNLIKVQRMVSEGKVAVMLRGGHKYEVNLPGEVGKLLPADLAYISAQIDAMSQPMSAEEQARFLASQNAPAEASLSVVR